jgi:hypothetical protein
MLSDNSVTVKGLRVRRVGRHQARTVAQSVSFENGQELGWSGALPIHDDNPGGAA